MQLTKISNLNNTTAHSRNKSSVCQAWCAFAVSQAIVTRLQGESGFVRRYFHARQRLFEDHFALTFIVNCPGATEVAEVVKQKSTHWIRSRQA